MSRIRFTNQTASPSTPDSGKTELYTLASDKVPRTKDDAGLVRVLMAESATKQRFHTVATIAQGTTSYTPASGSDALWIECIGGGAQGGGVNPAASNAGAGGGGGGGAYSATYSTSNVDGSHTVAVGAGGSTSTGKNTGQDGGDTTFKDTAAANICVAKGGSGGLAGSDRTTNAMSGTSGAGGLATAGTGDVKLAGGGGGQGWVFASGTTGCAGYGGGNGYNGGGGAQQRTGQAAGRTGGKYGGGGSGAGAGPSSSQNGGAGADGVIFVHELRGVR